MPGDGRSFPIRPVPSPGSSRREESEHRLSFCVGDTAGSTLALSLTVGSEPQFPLWQRSHEVLTTRAQHHAGMWKTFGK